MRRQPAGLGNPPVGPVRVPTKDLLSGAGPVRHRKGQAVRDVATDGLHERFVGVTMKGHDLNGVLAKPASGFKAVSAVENHLRVLRPDQQRRPATLELRERVHVPVVKAPGPQLVPHSKRVHPSV